MSEELAMAALRLAIVAEMHGNVGALARVMAILHPAPKWHSELPPDVSVSDVLADLAARAPHKGGRHE